MPSHPPTTSVFSPHTLFHLLGVCLAYFESKFNPSAVYENSRDGSTGFGLFQIRDNEWCDHGKNLCSVSCTGGSLSLQSLGGKGACRTCMFGGDRERELAVSGAHP